MKIFCIGLSKTGTTSLVEALRILGFRSAHWDETSKMIRFDGPSVQIDRKAFESWDGFADTPIARVYRQLDREFENSKFILTVRDLPSWRTSFRDQFRSGVTTDFAKRLHLDLYGTDGYDRKLCSEAFLRHADLAREYFRDRDDDFLVMDVCAGEGFEKLCPFLGVPIPDVEFPRLYSKNERYPASERFLKFCSRLSTRFTAH